MAKKEYTQEDMDNAEENAEWTTNYKYALGIVIGVILACTIIMIVFGCSGDYLDGVNTHALGVHLCEANGLEYSYRTMEADPDHSNPYPVIHCKSKDNKLIDGVVVVG